MMTPDWNSERRQIGQGVAAFGRLSPEIMSGYVAMNGAGARTGLLNARTRELIALAVAITLRCDGCITVHSEAARRLGATEEELAEALGVAVSVNAGSAIIHAARTLDAFAATASV